MPKKGIHPILHTMTYVMKNGASRQVLTTKKMALPYILNQDTTTHPYWTGKTSTLEEGQEGSLARFRKRFGNLGVDFGEQEDQEPEASSADR